jgi:hypothetical protein
MVHAACSMCQPCNKLQGCRGSVPPHWLNTAQERAQDRVTNDVMEQ